MKTILTVLSIIAGLAVATAPAHADCRWEWNGNGWQQICR
jgi:hypothetical protein